MSRRATVRAASFLVALFCVAGGLLVQSRLESAAYRRSLSNSYQHAFAELTAQLEGLDSALQKGRYATSPALLSALCTEAYGRACAAQQALGELPYSNVELEQTAAFLAKAGDYAWSLSRAAAGEETPTAQEREGLAGLARASGELKGRLAEIQEELNDGALSLEELEQAEQRLAEHQQGQVAAGSMFQEMEKEFPELPTLIYDGPFSEHLTGRAPKYLEGKPQVDAETARQTAALFLDRPVDGLELTAVGTGALPTYSFALEEEDSSLYLEVARQGSAVVELLTSRVYDLPQLLPESGRAIARDFLLEHGFGAMVETYFIRQGSLLTVNFAYQEGEVLCYPDLVKVTVALDTGDVVGFEAVGYLTNHAFRGLGLPAVSREQAQEAVAEELTVLSGRQALIPTAGQHEVLCWEFTCQAEDQRHVLVYVNAQSGAEEKILLLLEDENGTLVL